jgi:hypothetical protein
MLTAHKKRYILQVHCERRGTNNLGKVHVRKSKSYNLELKLTTSNLKKENTCRFVCSANTAYYDLGFNSILSESLDNETAWIERDEVKNIAPVIKHAYHYGM